jgi:hypothetical protein
MITYEQIQKANDGLKGIDFKGKNYVMVDQRVIAFRKLFPDGFIRTHMVSIDDGVCVMKAEVGCYIDNNHTELILSTGWAYEKESSSYINKTSYIENCETSAVGRALGFLGLGIEGGAICSAEELANAINNQKKTEKPMETPTTIFIRKMIRDTQERLGLASYEEARAKVFEMVDALVKSGTIKPVDWNKITLAEAEVVFEAIEYNFKGDKK